MNSGNQVEVVELSTDANLEHYESNSSSSVSVVEYVRPKHDGLERSRTVDDDVDGFVEEQSIITGGRSVWRPLNRSMTVTSQINVLEEHVTALSRIETHRILHETTVGSIRPPPLETAPLTKVLPQFGAGKPYPPHLPASEDYVVEFDGVDDPLHPLNWSWKKKVLVSAIAAFSCLTATMGSSIFSAGTTVVARIYGVTHEIAILATSLYILGFACGPIIWGPMSELLGRRLPIIVGGFGFTVFAIATATAENMLTILISRFFTGVFGSCPLAVVGAIFTDIYDTKSRNLALAVFIMTVFMGPLLGPTIGGFVVESSLGWRWTMYISGIMGFIAWIFALAFLPESYPPLILVEKARDLRRHTQNWGIHAKQEEIHVTIGELVSRNLLRPFKILFTEPIVLLVSIYMAFIYGLLYLFLTAYAIVFQRIYGMSKGISGLPYFGIIAGQVLGLIVVALINPSYVKKLMANHGLPVPEWRLPLGIVGGVSFSIGLFWFGWTGWEREIHWIVPTASGLLTGFGIFIIFLQLISYIVDAYLMFAASAIAANTFLRSLFGCIFPLFATYMFESELGIKYSFTILGGVSLLLVSMPVVFYLYGPKIRARSKMVPKFTIDAKIADEEKNIE